MKKQSWIKEKSYRLSQIFLVFIWIAVIIWYFGTYINSTSYICSKNPDKCVCEEYKFKSYNRNKDKFENKVVDYCEDLNKVTTTSASFASTDCNSHCIKFRLKTQAERDIDDCNNNPREDELCKCEEFEQLSKIHSWKYKNSNIVYSSGFNENIIPTKELMAVIDCKYEWVFYENTTGNCIKSRPKTECEKGNDDWTEEKLSPFNIQCKSINNTYLSGSCYVKDYHECYFWDYCIKDTINWTDTKTICREKI